jgi:CBS domain-containing protein
LDVTPVGGRPHPSLGDAPRRLAMLVRDLMTPDPATVLSTASVAQAIDVLETLDVRHVPVVDEQGTLLGMVSDRDVRALVGPYPAISDEHRAHVAMPVTRVMNAEVTTVDAEANVTEAIEALLSQRVGALPVVDADGDLVGIVSYVDVLRELGEVLASA